MNGAIILDYLADLERHNDAKWYHANKGQFEVANAEFEGFINELMLKLRDKDETVPLCLPKELTFKLQRDTRFSHDKSPYNPSFRAHIGPKGKLPIPCGYFIMLRPGNRSFLGGGLFADMFKDATLMIRSAIDTRGNRWNQIITAADFTENFTVRGAALKKVPAGYNPSHPQAEYLKNKSWYVEFQIKDELILQPDFIDYATDVLIKMAPFNRFLNHALEQFKMPVR